MTAEQKTQLESLRDQAKTLLDTAKDLNNLTSAEITLKEHYDEIVALLADKDATKAAADGLIQEVPGYITAVENERATKPTTTVKYGQYTISNDSLDDPYTVKLKVTVNTDGTIQLVEDNATDTAVSDNDSYWSKAKAMFEKFVGLTKDGASALKTDPDGGKADKVDAISKATVSSNAIKEAVLDALKD